MKQQEAVMATIYGTFFLKNGFYWDFFDDTIIGTSGNDTIYGLGGDDEIWAGDGNDVVYGGYGNDVIRLSNDVCSLQGQEEMPENNLCNPVGREKAYGQDGDDTIIGSSTDDILEGGDGLDHLYGRGGDDEISGNADSDWIWGESGQDKLSGGTGTDHLYGGSGFDHLSGDDGYDTLDGGSADDVLEGGAGGDVLIGGSGYDTFYFGSGFASHIGNPDVIVDFTSFDDVIDIEPFNWFGGPVGDLYIEDTISYGAGYYAALAHAEPLLLGPEKLNTVGHPEYGVGYTLVTHEGGATFAFVTDGVNGYLFGDVEPEFDGNVDPETNEVVDVAIVLQGLTSVSQFDFVDIM
jgi:Ca2+-binding RTX toxin-like protein